MPDAEQKPHYHVTAGLIWKEGRLLVSRRARGAHLAGFWEFPGGKQEPGEGLTACLARELKEELGIEVRVDAPLLTVDHEYEKKRISLHLFSCTWIRGEPAALQCEEIRWVAWEDLSGLLLPPPDREAVERLVKDSDRGAPACP